MTGKTDRVRRPHAYVYTGFLVVTLILLLFGFFVRSRSLPDQELLKQYHQADYSVSPLSPSDALPPLPEKAEWLVSGTYRGAVAFCPGAVIGRFTVSDVLYSANPLPGNELFVLEPLLFHPVYGWNTTSPGYVPMHEGCDYLLLLDRVNYPEGKTLSKKDLQFCTLVGTESGHYVWSKFLLPDDSLLIKTPDQANLSRKTLSSYSFVSDSEQMRDVIAQKREEMLRRFAPDVLTGK